MKKANKYTWQLIIATILIIFGIGLLITSFIVPPLGVIDSSILTAYGETLTFVGALIGIDYSYKFKIYRFRKDDNENVNN